MDAQADMSLPSAHMSDGTFSFAIKETHAVKDRDYTVFILYLP